MVSLAEALDCALRLAPSHRKIINVARNVNEELGLDWSEAKWRGIWKDHAAEAWLVKKKLGESLAQHQHGQKLRLSGDMRVAVVNDAHAPYQDDNAIALAAQVLRWWKPDVLIHNGDNVDFSGISRFDSNPARKYRAQDEIDIWQARVAIPLNEAAGRRCRKFLLPGNHDLRLLRLLWTNPDLFSVRSLHLPALFQAEELGMEYVGYAVVIDNALEVSHGTRVSVNAGYAAKAELTQRGYSISTMTGHNHRAGRHELKRPYGGTVFGQEIPCLCSCDPEYGVDPNWVQGLGLAETRNGNLWGQAVVFNDDYTCQVGNKFFGV